jgi:hypothetical protein
MTYFNRKFMYSIVLLAILALGLPQMLGAADGNAALDRAMQTFVIAVKTKNAPGVLSAFSRTVPWQHVTYDVVTQRIQSRTAVTYAQMQRDFRMQKNWYDCFFGSDEEVGQLHTKIRGMRWSKQGTTFRGISTTWARFYVSWRQEGGKWFITEIGETVS